MFSLYCKVPTVNECTKYGVNKYSCAKHWSNNEVQKKGHFLVHHYYSNPVYIQFV